MPSWKKVITSGSDASLASLFVTNSVTSSIFSGSRYIGQSFTGSLFGTASWAQSASWAPSTTQWTSSGANIYYNVGNVGINTTTPATKLQVNGTFASNALWTDNSGVSYWGSYSTAYGGLTWSTGYATVFSTSGNVLYFGAGGASPKMVLDTTGNVGIGTTSPSLRLQVDKSTQTYNASSPSGAFAVSSLNAGNAILELGVDPTALAYIQSRNITSLTTYQLLLNPNGGNVGIGTTTPTLAKLQVNGNVYATSFTGSLQGTASFAVSSSRAVSSSFAISASWAPNTGGSSQWTSSGANIYYNVGNVGIGNASPGSALDVDGVIFGGNATAVNGSIILQDQYSNGHLTNFGTNQSSGGPVIGYAVYPSSSTNVFASATGITIERAAFSLDGNSFRWYTGGSQTVSIGAQATLTQKMILTNAGNLGISQTNPTTAKLVIGGTAGQEGLDLATSDQYANLRVIRNSLNGSDKDMYIGYQSGGGSKLHLYSNNLETITVTGNNVGINNTSPTAKLHISSSTNNALRIESQENSDTNPVVYIEGNKGGSSPYTATLIELRSNTEFRGKGIHMTTAGSNTRWFAGVPYNFGGSGYQIGYDGSTNGRAYTPASASLFIDTSRNVIVGGTSAGGKLTIDAGATTYAVYAISQGTSWASGIRAQAANANNGYFIMSFVSGSQYGSLQAGDSSAYRNISLNHQGGNVAIGATSPGAKLDVAGGALNVRSSAAFSSDAGNLARGNFLNYVSYNATCGDILTLGVQNTSAMNAGAIFRYSLGLSGNASGQSLTVSTVTTAGTVTTRASLSTGGTFTVSGDLVAYGSPSDISLKTNIKPLRGALEKINKLQGVSFTWKKNTEVNKLTGIKDDIGFIAQEVKKVLPELVRENENGLLSLRDKSITALLVEAIKEQQKQIDELKQLLKNK